MAEILKREPAITVAKEGSISVLGLVGYTQIRLDGRAPFTKNPLELDLSQVEKIESLCSAQSPWSYQPRYGERPVNLGDAHLYGMNVDWRIALRDFWPEATRLDFRGGLAWAQSHIASLPGPDNRLEGSSPWRANLDSAVTWQLYPSDSIWMPIIDPLTGCN